MLPKTMNRGMKALGTACLAAGLFAAAGASAGTLVTTWGYNLDNGFTAHQDFKSCVVAGVDPNCNDAAPGTIAGDVTGSAPNTNLTSPNPNAPPGFGPGNAGFSQAWTRLEWAQTTGIPNASNSSLSIAGNNMTVPGNFQGMIDTNAGFENTVTFTHANKVLGPRDNFLWNATLTDVLRLQPLVPPDSTFTAPIITIGINFRETPNNVPANDPVGDEDIFVLDLDDVIGPADFVCDMAGDCTIVQVFPFDMILYQATIALESLDAGIQGLHQLTDAQCTAAGALTGCIGVRTPETATTTFQASFRIDALEVPVPEPGTIALLGLGLVGLGFARRMRKA